MNAPGIPQSQPWEEANADHLVTVGLGDEAARALEQAALFQHTIRSASLDQAVRAVAHLDKTRVVLLVASTPTGPELTDVGDKLTKLDYRIAHVDTTTNPAPSLDELLTALGSHLPTTPQPLPAPLPRSPRPSPRPAVASRRAAPSWVTATTGVAVVAPAPPEPAPPRGHPPASAAPQPISDDAPTQLAVAPRPRWAHRSGSGRVLCLLANKGGVGRSTLASLLAATLAADHHRVVLVDANLQQPDLAGYLGCPGPGPTLATLAAGGAITEKTIAAALVHIEGLALLAGDADRRATDPRVIRPETLRDILRTLRRTHDWIVVDTPVAVRYDSYLERALLAEGDRLVVVTTPNAKATLNNEAWLESVRGPRSAGGANLDPDRVSVLLNMATANTDATETKAMPYQWLGQVPRVDELDRLADHGKVLDALHNRPTRTALRQVIHALGAPKRLPPPGDAWAAEVKFDGMLH